MEPSTVDLDLETQNEELREPVHPIVGRDRMVRWRSALIAALLFGLLITVTALPSETRRRLVIGLFEQRLLFVLLIGFNLLALSLLWSAGQRIDVAAFLFFHRKAYRSKGLDRVMFWLTQIGNGLTGFLMAGFFYAWGIRRLSLVLILGTLSLWLIVETIKLLTLRTRPFYLFEDTKVIGWKERGQSFPSGHTTQTFFLALMLVDYFAMPVFLAVVIYLVAFLVGFTRIYVGMHYPRDVIAGAILGTVWGILGSLITDYLFGGPI